MRWIAKIVLMLVAVSPTAALARQRPQRVEVGWDNSHCTVTVARRTVDLTDIDKLVPTLNKHVYVVVAHGPNTPFRCVGEAIYKMQLAGVQRVGFISEPSPTRQ